MMSVGLIGFILGNPVALASNLPTGAQVVSGEIDINTVGSNTLNIVQGTQSAIVNWQSFDIGHGALVDIVQPNIDAAMLSRVIGNNLSEIHGSLNANGHLYLINPNGIIFGSDAQINVHALIASSLDMADSSFLSGNISFVGDSEGEVMNLGEINADEFAALIGGKVVNEGTIISPGGSAALLAGDATLDIGEASGGKISLDLSGLLDGSANNSGSIDVSSATESGGQATILGGSVDSSGSIEASGSTGGGRVLIGGDYLGSNSDFSNSQKSVLSGSVSVNALESGDAGRVIVWSDERTDFTGSIEAIGGNGFVETSSKNNLQASGVVIAPGGEWLLDPRNVTISSITASGSFDSGNPNTFTPSDDSSTVDVSTITSSLSGGTDVTITTGSDGVQNGDISIATPISAAMNTSDATLTLNAAGGISNSSMSNGIQATGSNKLNIVLSAGGAVDLQAQIDTNQGDFTSSGTDFTNRSLGFIITSGGDVTLNHTGAVSFQQMVNLIGTGGTGGALSINDSASSVDLSASVQTASSNIDFGDNPLTLGTTATVETTGAGNISFGSTVDGDGDQIPSP